MSEAITQFAKTIADSMAGLAGVDVVEDRVRVTTHCLYPSNGLIRIAVRLSGTSVVVSDERGAFNEAQSAGLDVRVADRGLRHLVSPYGASIENGVIFAKVPTDAAAITTVFVANASRAVADWLYAHLRIKPARDFRILLSDMLTAKFETVLHHDVEIAGARGHHKFANLISLPRGRRILIDPVFPERASLTGRIVAHLDVKDTNDPLLVQQRLIYDEADRWDADSLNLLALGAVAVPFSRSGEVMERLSSNA